MKTPATVTPRAHRIHLKGQAAVLLRSCPVDGTNPDCCPLCELRSLPLAARKKWVANLSASELEYLLMYHSTCAAERNRAVGFARGLVGSLAEMDSRVRV